MRTLVYMVWNETCQLSSLYPNLTRPDEFTSKKKKLFMSPGRCRRPRSKSWFASSFCHKDPTFWAPVLPVEKYRHQVVLGDTLNSYVPKIINSPRTLVRRGVL